MPVPFCLVPKVTADGKWWIQENGNALPGRASVLYGGFGLAFLIATAALGIAGGVFARDARLMWTVIIVYPPGVLAMTGFVVWGLFLLGSRVRVEYDPHSEQVRVFEVEPGFAEQQLAEDPAGNCTLIIQDVVIRADNKVVAGTWRGVALVLRVEDWSFVMACQNSRKELAACVASLPVWLKDLPQEEGPLLRRRGVLNSPDLMIGRFDLYPSTHTDS